MGRSDGEVLGLSTVVDHGPTTDRWNLVVVAEGYQRSERERFAGDANALAETLRKCAPFDALWPAINIFRVDVASTDSGADDPSRCGGTGAVARTYFDASFCNYGIRRLLLVDDALVLETVDRLVPAWHAILVAVNTPVHGGAGGVIGTYSRAPGAIEIALHELAHSAFGLADEYEYWQGCGIDRDRDRHPPGEPAEPNVTLRATRDALKWASLVRPETPLPTKLNPDCRDCDEEKSPFPSGTVGAFEGADYHHCGAFRPEYHCRMRALGHPFCAVCRAHITSALRPFLPAPHERTAEVVDVTFLAGAPRAAGDPCTLTDPRTGARHVFFRGVDGHLHHVRFPDAEGDWAHRDLTHSTGAPLPAGDPSAAIGPDGAVHVVWRDEDGSVHELRLPAPR